MARTMFDTTNIPADVIPANAEIVAGYVNGRYPSFAAVSARCPNAVHVSIAVSTAADADVLDIEQGDATPSDAPGWTARQHARGNPRPSLYCELSQVVSVISHLLAAGFTQHVDYELWVAAYDNRSTPTGHGEAAKQYIDHGPHGENYDMSVVFLDGWPHLAQPATRTWTFEEEPMHELIPPDGVARPILVAPPHGGGCQGGYGNVWISFGYDNPGHGQFTDPLPCRIVGIKFDGTVFALWDKIDAENVPVPRTRASVALPEGTAQVSVTNHASNKNPDNDGPYLAVMVEAEVRGVPAA